MRQDKQPMLCFSCYMQQLFFLDLSKNRSALVSEDSLEYEAAMRTKAEVLGVVQTNHFVRTAGTGDPRQVAGGSTLEALPILIW